MSQYQRGGRALLQYCATHNVHQMRRDIKRRRRQARFLAPLCHWLVAVTQLANKRHENPPPDMRAWFGLRYRLWSWAMGQLVSASNRRATIAR